MLDIADPMKNMKSGKNGNIVRFLIITRPAAVAITSHEKFDTRVPHLTPATIPGNTSGNICGKNGNTTCLLTRSHSETITAQFPEKISTYAGISIPTVPPARNPATISARTALAPARLHIIRCCRHTSDRQPIENQNRGKNGNDRCNVSGNNIGTLSSNGLSSNPSPRRGTSWRKAPSGAVLTARSRPSDISGNTSGNTSANRSLTTPNGRGRSGNTARRARA